jgi:hypothetical protein
VDCLEFRRAAGADPQHLEPAALAHARGCPRCAAHLRELQALDERILAALRVPLSSPGRAAGGLGSPAVTGLDRRRWMALAASIVAGVLVGTLLWVANPRHSLAQDLVAHLAHEPEALVPTDLPVDPARAGEVLARGGIRLRPEAVTVTYANSCEFRGRLVPHLVVRTGAGPVTVMVLRDERPARPVDFREQGYAGRIVPAGPGSIAVIGVAGTDLESITAAVLAAVEWL